MRPVVTAGQMRAIDAETISQIGLPGAVLMETAGRAVARRAVRMLEDGPSMQGGAAPLARFAVVCGGGNNGGDGFVAARVLQERGFCAELFLAVQPQRLQGDAKLHADAFLRCGGQMLSIAEDEELVAHAPRIETATVVIDALLGTGLSRELRGHLADIIEIINACAVPVLAVDIPSGLRADDGATLGVSIRAVSTVVMGCAKVGNVGAPGFERNGRVEVAEMGIPIAIAKRVAELGLLESEDVASCVPRSSGNTHKGQRGHVLAIAGSQGKRGAGRLAAMAALRGGAGLTTLAAAVLDPSAPDPVMTAVVRDEQSLADALVGKSAVLVGPGMSTDAAGRTLVQKVLETCELPMVLDADALNHLGSDLSQLPEAKGALVLTPHPGEAGRLLGIDTASVQSDRIGAVRELARRSKAVVVLKGARTCICDGRDPSLFVAINPTGGAELSTAGTGDVLAGLLASLLAQGIAGRDAAWLACYWHGEAGQIALDRLGGPGLIASDLLAAIPIARDSLSASHRRPARVS
jgi:ADP-dependent NAD(P)H-hydrate dehydratase / NAD(P)H-hydrate epimerase